MTSLPVSTRYFAPGVTKIRFIPTIAASSVAPDEPGYLVPTDAERQAGTDLSDEVADIGGWNISSEQLATPGLSPFTGSVPGRLTVDACSITFYASEDGADVRTVLTRGQVGFIEIADAGDTAGLPADIFPIRVSSIGKVRAVNATSAMTLVIQFAVTRQPAEDVEIPAAA